MSCGTIIAAPAVVFSAIFGWNLWWCVALIGVPAVLYTMVGGVQAVTWVDVKQMFLIVGALLAVVITLLIQIPVSPSEALHVAGAAGRLRVFDFSFSLTNTYTFWSGLIGGTFLMLSYFGTDQSQVQRYLAAKSVDEARTLAADQRVLEDPAASARAARRRARVRVLPVRTTSRSCSTRRTSAPSARRRRNSYAAPRAAVHTATALADRGATRSAASALAYGDAPGGERT